MTLWILVICIPFLSGCGEVLNEYYISNHTDSALDASLVPFFIETVDLSSGLLIEDIQSSARSSLPQAMSYEREGDTLQFAIPPKTTVFLGISSGGNDLFQELEVSSSNRQLIMDDSNYDEYFTVHDNFIGAVVHVLNVD